MNIAIIGGGASGLVASIYAKNKTNKVTILERNQECGKKILATGNGRCNYWNEQFDLNSFHSNNKEMLKEWINDTNKQEILTFFNQIGIIPRIKNGYYYPISNQALSIKDALVTEAKKRGVLMKTDYLVQKIEKKENKFIINKELSYDKIIIATGGGAAPHTGSDKMGYQFAQKFSHTIITPLPSLVQLEAKETYLKKWAGIRSEVEASIYINNKFHKKERGEIQLTAYGVSGICIFNLSRYASLALEKREKVTLHIDFLPFIKEPIEQWLTKRNELLENRNIKELLNGLLNQKLITVLLEISHINNESTYETLEKNVKHRLCKNLKDFELSIISTKDFENAQVTIGGVPLTEIKKESLESIYEKGLYFTGEILDVDADCGGYNLGFAWLTGMIAGKNIQKGDES